MRVLAWVPQDVDTSPGQRFRIEQWESYLLKEGIELVYSPFSSQGLAELLRRPGKLPRKAWGIAKALARRLAESFTASAFDLVYVFREGALLGPAMAERILRWSGVPFVFDFDDAVWVRYKSPANSYLSYLRFPGKTAALCRMARHVMAGNPYLRDYAARYASGVTIVPTTIDTERYTLLPPRRNKVPVVGWTGSYSTAQYLGLVRGALQHLRRRRAFRMVVVGAESFRAEGVEVEHRPWRSATEVEDLSDFDVGIMPLPDATWERGKCGLKALQYMALGIPTVVSPIGVNAEIVVPGRNGFLASSEAEWEEALDKLLGDEPLREALGHGGRSTVEQGYSAAVHGPRVARLFQEARG